MAKKTRHTKAKHRAKAAKAIQVSPSQQLNPLIAKPQSPAKIPPEAQAPRYQHMMPELRYIGILAGAMIIILIVLSFVLR